MGLASSPRSAAVTATEEVKSRSALLMFAVESNVSLLGLCPVAIRPAPGPDTTDGVRPAAPLPSVCVVVFSGPRRPSARRTGGGNPASRPRRSPARTPPAISPWSSSS